MHGSQSEIELDFLRFSGIYFVSRYCSISENNKFLPIMVLLFQMCPKTKNFSLLWMKNGSCIFKELRSWKTWFVS
jgi:hypothetical protein